MHAPYLEEYLEDAFEPSNQRDEFAALLVANSVVDRTNRGSVSDILEMLLGAGSDTTSVALQNILKVIALHPEAAEVAQSGR